MSKATFHKKWYYRLLQVLFWGSLVLVSTALIVLSWLGSDVQIAGVFWAGLLALVYWLIKKIFYYLMFKEKTNKYIRTSRKPENLDGRI